MMDGLTSLSLLAIRSARTNEELILVFSLVGSWYIIPNEYRASVGAGLNVLESLAARLTLAERKY